ncbi:MAG: helix-turn-helix domain-containing protein [Candidatus Aminicenantales bacterium]
MIKKIEDLDCYEILNLPSDASQKEIENSYLLAIATYHQDSLASYGVFLDEERAIILNKVEAAFQTLRDPEKKKAYDSLVRGRHPEFRQKASFRKTIERLMIEDASEEGGLWDKIKSVVGPVRRRRENRTPAKNEDGRDWRGLSDDFYYYGEYLKKVRERRGLSLEDIAKQCGVDPSRLESLEQETPDLHSNGEKNLEVLRCYAKCLGLNSDDGRDSSFPTRFR